MSLLTLFLPQGSPFEPVDPPDLEITLPVPTTEDDVPYFDVLGRVEVSDGAFEDTLIRHEEARIAYTEKTEQTIIISAPTTDDLIDFAGVVTPKLIYIESLDVVPLYYRYNSAANVELTINNGFILINGNLGINALYVSNKSTSDAITIKVVVLS